MEKVKIEKLITEVSRMSRGTMIQIISEIETMMSIYIAELLTSDKQKTEELICLILAPRVSLEDKRQVFCFLVDQYNPEFKKEHPNHNADLKRFVEQRNIYAHYPVDFSEDAIKKYKDETTFTFVQLKNSKASLVKRIDINERTFHKLIDDMNVYFTALKKLIKS